MQLKPVSLDVIAEAREEAQAVVATLMARLAPGEHVVRLGVDMEGQERPLSATLPITVEGDGGSDDLVGAEPRYLDNFIFLLTCGLAQTLCSGVMYLRSTGADGQATVRAWYLCWGALNECPAAEAAELLGGRESGTYVDAFGVHSADDGEDDGEAVYPPVAYTVL
ncbi:hypothetical protein GCM10010377_81450 [Streptomyces viridiviolaceus]|uniref:Uncharacterized protein n=1 Tax=Streptomyces viridiviolaceus TaxID=68282 RepID=A0ABW2EI75_9ACTN|nr:hypothetical protein [Streptomyces viridiviolaceus]GHB79138.1 hypothetical protein GCM10010377_81450 [Streptomyces viridiviolaceus]